jgi:hypothetical protein
LKNVLKSQVAKKKFIMSLRVGGVSYDLKDPNAKTMGAEHNSEKGGFSSVSEVSWMMLKCNRKM